LEATWTRTNIALISVCRAYGGHVHHTSPSTQTITAPSTAEDCEPPSTMSQEAQFRDVDGSTSEGPRRHINMDGAETGAYQSEFDSDSTYRLGGSSSSFHSAIEQSLSFPSNFPSGAEVQKRRPQKAQQKMHQCEVCSKEFSRPSGLRTHMNMHSHAQPYKCDFPACSKSFSVLSNARRHYRTHGEEPPSSVPQYQVNFDVPVTAPPPPLSLSQAPFRVRRMRRRLRRM